MRRVFHPETNGVKASPHRLKWMLSRGALAAPSDPWNIHAAPVSPHRQTTGPEAKDWCAQHYPGSPIKEFGADASKRASMAKARKSK
jgi:hypothetical protein